MKKVLSVSALLLAIQFLGASMALAQPDVNNAPKGDNPPNRRVGGLKNTTEQLAKKRAQRIETKSHAIQLALGKAGFTDATLQKTILDYYKGEEDARSKIGEQYQKIVVALKSKTTPDAQLAAMLNDLRASVDEEKVRHQKSFATFSDKLKLAENPRLDAVLMTQSITGDERTFAN